jgi:linoleoyl-CoA desaturase
MQIAINKPRFAKNASEEAIFRAICSEVNAFIAQQKNASKKGLVLKAVVFSALFVGSYATVLLAQNFWVLLMAYVVLGVALVLLGLNFAHDFAHNTIFKSKRLNNAFFEGLFMLMGINGYLWKTRHTHSHHNYPNTEGYDVDVELGAVVHLSAGKTPKKHHKWQHIYAPVLYSIYTLYWVLYKDFVLFFQKRHANLTFAKHGAKENVKLWLFKIIYLGYVIVLPLLVSPLSAGQVLLAFLVFHAVAAWLLLFTFLITHHVEATQYFSEHNNVLSSTSWLMHQVQSSNDFHPFSPTANYIFGGFNCHVAHHLFPNVCHVHYPAISQIVYKNLLQNGIVPNKTTFAGGVVSHIRVLKNMGTAKAA